MHGDVGGMTDFLETESSFLPHGCEIQFKSRPAACISRGCVRNASHRLTALGLTHTRLRADLRVYAEAVTALEQSVKKDFESAIQKAEHARVG